MDNTLIDNNSPEDESLIKMERISALIEPLTDPDIGKVYRSELRQKACLELNVGERTIRNLVRRFKTGGPVELIRKIRKDKGKYRRFDRILILRASALLHENPGRSMDKILSYLQADPHLKESAMGISSSCLYHNLRKAGIDFKELQKTIPGKKYHKFEALFPNLIWQGDARDGIQLPDPEKPSKFKMTYLFGWIDDYSRLIIHAQYYWDEKLPRLEDSFRQGVLKYGLPDKIYVDNGATYRSHQFLFILSQLKVIKTQHLPYRPWCKGKIESLMKEFKKFQEEAKLANMQTIDELNTALSAWIDIEHNRKLHSQTGETPIHRFTAGLERRPARRVNDLEAFNNSFYCKIIRTVDPYGKISLFTNSYSVPEVSPGTTLAIRYNPFDLSNVYLFDDKNKCKLIIPAKTIGRKQAMTVAEETKKTKKVISEDSKNYFARLREKQAELHSQTGSTNAFTELKNKQNGDKYND